MMGLEFMGDVPFRQVYIHGLVRDADTPEDVEDQGQRDRPAGGHRKVRHRRGAHGAAQGAAPGTDIVLTEERMESSRAFANKIWNAARFLFMNMERSGVEPWVPETSSSSCPSPSRRRSKCRSRTAGSSAG